jgi:hypothetical protein
MNPLAMSRTALFLLLVAGTATGGDKTPHVHLQGTITGWSNQVYQKHYARNTESLMGNKKFYDLKGVGLVYQIAGVDHPWRGAVSACGPFQIAQTIDYRIEDGKIFIRRENKKEQKCDIASARMLEDTKAGAPSAAPPSTPH